VSRFGTAARTHLAAQKANPKSKRHATRYATKNATPDLSVAVSTQEFLPIHEAFLTWLVTAYPEPPRSVLDLGCESGVLTLALAKLWPGSDFVATDKEDAAIRVAKTLAARVGVTNSLFHRQELRGLPATLKGAEFDMVLAACVFHEVLKPSGDQSLTSLSIDHTPEWDVSNISSVNDAVALLSPNGTFVSVNRWPGAEETLRWIRLTEKSGLQIDLEHSTRLNVHSSVDGDQELAITVHKRVEDPVICRTDDVLALHSDLLERPIVLNGSPAEAFRRSLSAERISGFDATDGSGTLQVELLVAGPIAALYQASTRGFREITFGPTTLLPLLARQMRDQIASFEIYVEMRFLRGIGNHPWLSLYGLEALQAPNWVADTGIEASIAQN